MSSLVDRIEQVILSKKLTFNRVEHDCGFGNGTIKRWSTQSPRLDKLIAVSQYLDISLDYLVFGSLQTESYPAEDESFNLESIKSEQGLICDNSPLEEEEANLVAMYRLLPDYKKEDVFDIICTLYQKHVERKKESIYWTYKEDRLKSKDVVDSDGSSQGGIA